ncbi:hypothetical protein GCM10007940_40160 [Portibacter lacus]|uniref:PKD domain-containing protein n=2 Tax=Portibacter lacus TaxID=1099794 RepID=A0AA37SX93_9BACT|nr:hypothetical protein GCM10007940_40160 [Portibacter lacus]
MVKNSLYILGFILSHFLLIGQNTIAEGFYDEQVSVGFINPVGIEFDEDGIGYLWEKVGKVYAINDGNEKSVILDISEEVGSWGDHGLTGFGLDPSFKENGYIYLAYTVDPYYLYNYGTAEYNPDSTILKNATIGRVSRFTLDLSNYPYQVISNSKKILVGKDKTDGFPILADFHGIGSLTFGNDGSLFVGCGDSGLDNEPGVTYHTEQAIRKGIIDSTMLIGSYRAQSLHSLNGKLIRVDKYTGDGLSSNPFYNAENPRSPQSRIWALGLRNPFNFVHIPGTGGHNQDLGVPGVLLVGDVGSSFWEEFNLIDEKGLNLGWPVYEGHHNSWPYGFYKTQNPHAPNLSFEEGNCERPFYMFEELIKQENALDQYEFKNPCVDSLSIPLEIPTFANHRPIMYYNNISWNQPLRTFIPGFDETGKAIEIAVDSTGISPAIEGYSAIPGDWYDEGNFPDSLNHSLIASDFSGWIKFIKLDQEYSLEKIIDLRSDVKGIVNVTLNKNDGCIYYVNIATGELHRICYGGNPPPVAIAKADTIYGNGELTVQFSAAESYDPNQLPIKVHWDFNDGSESSLLEPTHTYTSSSDRPLKYIALLTVTDSLGASSTDSIAISLNNSPPEVKIVSPGHNTKYAVNGYNRLDLKAMVNDLEEENIDLNYTWQIHLHHNLHYHSEEPVNLHQYSSTIEPVGCGELDKFWYRITLNVKDQYGLEGHDEVIIEPNCSEYVDVNWRRFYSNGNDIYLNWVLKQPEQISKIIVQKINNAGQISDIGSTVNSTFTDLSPLIGENRYRLKMYTGEHSYFYSIENTIDFPLNKPLNIFPNPNPESIFNLILDQHLDEEVDVSVFSMDGVKIFNKKITELQNRNLEMELNLLDIPAGTYFLFLQNGDRLIQEKIQILR